MNAIENYKRSRQILFELAEIHPQSKIVSTKGPVENVHFLEMGQGKPLIIVHGGGSHASEWVNIMKPLAEHFHLYVVDRPGHGLSDPFNYQSVAYKKIAVEFLRSFADVLGLEKFHLMGNSMGGYYSLAFSMAHPEKINKLLLIGAPAGLNRWVPPMLRILGLTGINQLITKTVARPSIANLKMVHKKLLVADIKNLSDEYLSHGLHNGLLPGNMMGFTSMLENVLSLKGWRSELYLGDKLHSLEVPVRFIWGTQDVFEKPDTGMAKASAIADYKFAVVKDAGHCPWLDQPEECARLIISFLDDKADASHGHHSENPKISGNKIYQ